MEKKNSKGGKNLEIDRRQFVKSSAALTALPFWGVAPFLDNTKMNEAEFLNNRDKAKTANKMNASHAVSDLLQFPFLNALFGRRARRFGLGMEIPSGPLAYRSEKEPVPLSETEQMLLVAAATGVSGWNFGVPFSPACA
jgi:hypothetical protein